MTIHASTMSIHAETMGDYGDRSPRGRPDSEFGTCPSCGSRMHYKAKLCFKCNMEERSTRGVPKERRERFELALQAGWTLQELYGNEYTPGQPQKDKLPTRREIVRRLIEKWWKEEGQ